MICKNFKDKEKMRQAGRTAATILDRLCDLVKPGMSTWEIDQSGGELMKDFGVKVLVKAIVPAIVFSLPTLAFLLTTKWFMVLV